jgi:WD40 repeat protein
MTLKCHTEDVKAKPDLTDGFRDNNRKLWDSMIGDDHKKTFIDHFDNVTIVVPPDDKQTVSTSFEKNIKLWSTGIREHQRTLDAKPDWVFLMAFSPDGKQIASSSNNAIDLWDAATVKHQKTTGRSLRLGIGCGFSYGWEVDSVKL